MEVRRIGEASKAAAITAAFVVLRLLVSPFIGLGVDESYTASISRELALSYFDHPPLHQWIVHAFQSVLGSGPALRAPFIIISGAASWLMFLFTRRLFGPAAGVWATLALNLSGFFTAVAGAWILPDGPLDACLLAAATALAAALFPEDPLSPPRRWTAWLCAGLFIGLAGLSKYQAVFFGVGLIAFLATTPGRRRLLADPAVIAAGVLALILVSPVIVWNAQHGWVSFRFQGGRGAAGHGPSLWALALSLLGQAGLLLPWVFAPLAFAGWRGATGGPRDQRRWLCLMLGAPSIIFFGLAALASGAALPHWSMSGWLMLFPILGDLLARASASRAWPRVWTIASTAALILLWGALAADANTGWIGEAFPGLGRDPSLETLAWKNLRPVVESRARNNPRCLFILAMSWREGGKIGAAVGDIAPVRVFSNDPRGFGFLRRPPSLQGCDAVIVERRGTEARHAAQLAAVFAEVSPMAFDEEGRAGADEADFTLLDGHDLLQPLPPAYGAR